MPTPAIRTRDPGAAVQTPPGSGSAHPRRPRRPARHSVREALLGIVFCVPALAGLGTFVVFPLFQAVFLSTRGTDINGNPTRSVGMANFAALFTPGFGDVLLHTLFFTLLVVAAGVGLPLALAVPLAQRLPGMRVFRTLFTLPFAYSSSAASVVWLLMLDPSMSPVDWLLRLFGAAAPGWTTESPWALLTVAWATVWVVAGFNLLVLSAGLAGVEEDVLEAARIDGATGWRQFTGVVLPMMMKHLVDDLTPAKHAIVVVPIGLLLAYGALRFANVMFGELRDLVFGRVAERAMRRAALNVFEHLHRLDLDFHLTRRTGGLSRDIERGVSGINSLLRFMLFNILPTLLEIGLVAVILLFNYGASFAVIIGDDEIASGSASVKTLRAEDAANNQHSVPMEQVADYVLNQIVCGDGCDDPEHHHHHNH